MAQVPSSPTVHDVVVIGSGAGGGTVTNVLGATARGRKARGGTACDWSTNSSGGCFALSAQDGGNVTDQ